jgi:hypothetical protein
MHRPATNSFPAVVRTKHQWFLAAGNAHIFPIKLVRNFLSTLSEAFVEAATKRGERTVCFALEKAVRNRATSLWVRSKKTPTTLPLQIK